MSKIIYSRQELLFLRPPVAELSLFSERVPFSTRNLQEQQKYLFFSQRMGQSCQSVEYKKSDFDDRPPGSGAGCLICT